MPLIEKIIRKEVDPSSGVYIVHDVFAVAYHALFVLTDETKHLHSLLQLTKDPQNGSTAVHLLREQGRAAAEIVPETRKLLERGNIKQVDRVKHLEEFIAIATGEANIAE